MNEGDNRLKVLDLFSGCGGLSYGFQEAGFDIVAGIDNWGDALLTFEKNHPGSKVLELDLGNFDPSKIQKDIDSEVDIVIGGPPCQGFSISGKRDPNDPRNKLYQGFVKSVDFFKPKAFVLENVPNLASMAKGRILNQIIDDFTSLGYDVKYKILLASDFGVPQNRRRLVIVGILANNSFEFPDPTFVDDKRTCLEAISDLPEHSVADGTKNDVPILSDFQKAMRKETNLIYNHQTTIHSPQTISTISLVPDGGNYKDLPEHLQGIRKVNIAWTRYNSNKPSLTIDTGHRHHFHYKFDRVPTVRESARLQSFPDSFVFLGSKTSQYKQVGNAVPPLLAYNIAQSMQNVLVEKKEPSYV